MASREQVWDGDLLDQPHRVPDKSRRVRWMFDHIAPTYELVNRLFSAGRDGAWRRKAVLLAEVTVDDQVLDVACGTGDFARAFAAADPRSVVGCDFAQQMLLRAANRPSPVTSWCGADGLNLPFADHSFSLTSCAFGVRNFQNLRRGLVEMFRVLRPGGRAVILEFTRPKPGLRRRLYEWYTGSIMPTLASWISRDKTGAYRYLPSSVVSFVDAQEMCALLREVGFARTLVRPLTFGVVTVYVAWRD